MFGDARQMTEWLERAGLGRYADKIAAEDLSHGRLVELSREDLADLGVARADRDAVMLALAALRQGDTPPTAPGPEAPDYAPALDPRIADACRDLARSPASPWVEAAFEQWPGPIAHEYHRLRELLAEGQLIPAIWQLKDLAETLLKFPALILARDLIEHGGDMAARRVRRGLLSQPLTFGAWLGTVERVLMPAAAEAGGALMLPGLAGLLGTPDGKPSAWSRLLSRLVAWRNELFGHGALRLAAAELFRSGIGRAPPDRPAPECAGEQIAAIDTVNPTEKRLVIAHWVERDAPIKAPLLCSTMRRILAAHVARPSPGQQIGIRDLPEESEFDVLKRKLPRVYDPVFHSRTVSSSRVKLIQLSRLGGGLAVIHHLGVFLFDDWHHERLPVREVARPVRFMPSFILAAAAIVIIALRRRRRR